MNNTRVLGNALPISSMRSIPFYNTLVLLLNAENYKYHRNVSKKYGLPEP